MNDDLEAVGCVVVVNVMHTCAALLAHTVYIKLLTLTQHSYCHLCTNAEVASGNIRYLRLSSAL
jgi:hypothetical protein